LNNTFASSFLKNLPEGVKNLITSEQLAGIVDNPQILINPEASDQLEKIFLGAGPQGQELFNQTVSVLQSSLSTALMQVFTAFLILAVFATVANLFLTGIPQHNSKKTVPPSGK
jgi:hypothetical protein